MLFLAGVAQGADLPVKFLEYVESTGEQYVDTGYVPNNDTRITADFQLVQLGQARNYVFGEYKVIGSITYGRCQFSPGAQMFVGCGGGSKTKTIAWEEDTDWHTVALTNNTVWLDGASVYKGEGIGGNATSLYLFANNGSGTASDFATNRIGLVRIYNNSTIQRLMVPCEMGDGRVGFWDFIGGKFYGNENEGGANFVGGPEVASPLERLEYVKFASGAYLDTGIVPSNHETAIRFRDEKSAPGGYLFGLAINGDQWYYSFRSEGTAWLWYYSGRSTRGGGIYSANVDHTVVYNDVQGGLVFMDGLSLGKAIDVTPANKLWLGRMYQTYNYEGRIYWVKVTARDTGDVALWLEPMRILGLVGFYNPEAGKILLQSAGTLSAGPLQVRQARHRPLRDAVGQPRHAVAGEVKRLAQGVARRGRRATFANL